MNLSSIHAMIEAPLARVAAWLVTPAALAARSYVSWVFLHSGWLKLSDWGQTLALFQTEYRVPLLTPMLAATVGTGGELLFGGLVALGLFGRAGALGLLAVNAMAVLSFRHVLLADGFEAALAQHVLWAVLLAALALYGPGRLSIDGLALSTAASAPSRSDPMTS
ncbi:MAG: DoxX family protein [Pseudomonadota bacterium]